MRNEYKILVKPTVILHVTCCADRKAREGHKIQLFSLYKNVCFTLRSCRSNNICFSSRPLVSDCDPFIHTINAVNYYH